MTPTRADLERRIEKLIEKWRNSGTHPVAVATFGWFANELAALLTSEGPAQTQVCGAVWQNFPEMRLTCCLPVGHKQNHRGERPGVSVQWPIERPETPTVGTWQPMETAPKDGTWFLACATAPGWGATRVVRFAHPDDRLPIHGEGNLWPSPPTHWMPLPDAPKAPTPAPRV